MPVFQKLMEESKKKPPRSGCGTKEEGYRQEKDVTPPKSIRDVEEKAVVTFRSSFCCCHVEKEELRVS